MKRLNYLKPILIVLFVVTVFVNGKSQDIIIKTNGDEIKAKVVLIDIDKIQYKKFENIDGPAYTILKAEVFMIKYENGTKDVFGTEKEQIKDTAIKKTLLKNEIINKKGGDFYYKDKYIYNWQVKEILTTNATPEIAQSFKIGQRTSVAGTVISVVGSACAIGGLIGYMRDKQIGYQTIFIAGFGIMAIGIPVALTGNFIKKKSVEKYNKYITTGCKSKCYFGVAQNGISVTLKF